jgi:hypothetical protein
MNAIPLVRHLLLKDLRNQRGWLLFYWFLVLALPFCALGMRFNFSATNVPLFGIDIGFDFLLGLILIRTILLDPPGRTTHFLATRPVGWRAVFANKALFAGLFLIVPMWIAKVGTIYAVGVPLHGLDIPLFLIEITIEGGALLAFVVLFSLFLRSLPVVYLSLVAFVALSCAGRMLWWNYFEPKYVVPNDETISLTNCRDLMTEVGLIFTIGITALSRYRTKKILLPLILFVVGLGLSEFLPAYCSWNPSHLFSDQPSNLKEVASPLRDQLHFTLTGQEWTGRNYSNRDYPNGVQYNLLNHTTVLTGPDSSYFAKLVDYHAQATLRSGQVIESSYGKVHERGVIENAQGEVGGMSYAFLKKFTEEQLANFNPKERVTLVEDIFDLFNFPPHKFRGQDLNGASIEGVATLEIWRAVIVKTAPLRSGTMVLMPHRRDLLQHVAITSNRVRFDVATEIRDLTLCGDIAGKSNWENLTWLVVNRRKGEYLDLAPNDRASNGGIGLAGYNALFTHYEYGPNEGKSIPADWLNKAEICFISAEPCGRMNFIYEIPSIDLSPIN